MLRCALYRSSVALAVLAQLEVGCAGSDTGDPATETQAEGEVEAEAPSALDAEAEVMRIEAEMSELPGNLVVARLQGSGLSAETRELLRDADKVIVVLSDHRVRAYVVSDVRVPEGVPPTRVFSELNGDVVLGRIDELPDHIASEEPQEASGLQLKGVGLRTGDGRLFPGGTVPYEIDASFAGAELTTLRNAIAAWNSAISSTGEAIRARFVPRYPNDGLPYVRFMRSTDPSFCGRSAIGRNDNLFSNWWSHDIEIGCVDFRTIQHEMGHTVGLVHEHQRCDRDLFVGVTGSGIDCDRRCGGDMLDYGPFNYLSVMAYGYGSCGVYPIAPASWYYVGDPSLLGTGSSLDSFDVTAINDMYRGQPALPLFGAGIYYLILPEHAPGKGVIIPGHSLDNGAAAVQWQSLPVYLDQHWEILPDGGGFFEIRNRFSGKCLEIAGWTTRPGANLGQWDCFGGDHQKWTIAPSTRGTGRFDIINKFSNQSMDIEAYSTADGARVQQWWHHGDTNQRFALPRAF